MIKEIILTRHTRHKFTLTRHYILHIIKHLTVLPCLSCLSCRNMWSIWEKIFFWVKWWTDIFIKRIFFWLGADFSHWHHWHHWHGRKSVSYEQKAHWHPIDTHWHNRKFGMLHWHHWHSIDNLIWRKKLIINYLYFLSVCQWCQWVKWGYSWEKSFFWKK